MTLCRCRNVALTVLLIAALLAMRMSTLTAEFFVMPYQDFLKDTSTISAESASAKPRPPIYKPKRAFDLTCFSPATLPGIPLEERQLLAYLPFFAPPEVYLEIYVPPEARS